MVEVNNGYGALASWLLILIFNNDQNNKMSSSNSGIYKREEHCI